MVLRNAGGRVDDGVIRSLVVLDGLLGVGTVIVVHHTGQYRFNTGSIYQDKQSEVSFRLWPISYKGRRTPVEAEGASPGEVG